MRPISKVIETNSADKVNKHLDNGWILLCIAPSNKKWFSYCLGLPIILSETRKLDRLLRSECNCIETSQRECLDWICPVHGARMY